MSDDLIARLRDVGENEEIDHDISDTATEAAREIQELRDVIIRIRAEAQDAYEKGQESINHPY